MMIRDFRRRFYRTRVLSVPVLGLSELIQGRLGFSFSFPGADYFVFLLSTVIFLYGGWPFLKGLADELRNRNPGMMTLTGLDISVAYLYSAAVSFGLEGTPFYIVVACPPDRHNAGRILDRDVIGAEFIFGPGGTDKGAETRVFLLVDKRLTGSIALADTIRPESYKTAKQLQSRGIKCWILTGDNEQTAVAVGDELGVDGYVAQVLSDQKQE